MISLRRSTFRAVLVGAVVGGLCSPFQPLLPSELSKPALPPATRASYRPAVPEFPN